MILHFRIIIHIINYIVFLRAKTVASSNINLLNRNFLIQSTENIIAMAGGSLNNLND